VLWCGCTGGDGAVDVLTASSTSTPAGRYRGRNPGVDGYDYASTTLWAILLPFSAYAQLLVCSNSMIWSCAGYAYGLAASGLCAYWIGEVWT
jgi:hypothetical protein